MSERGSSVFNLAFTLAVNGFLRHTLLCLLCVLLALEHVRMRPFSSVVFFFFGIRWENVEIVTELGAGPSSLSLTDKRYKK